MQPGVRAHSSDCLSVVKNYSGIFKEARPEVTFYKSQFKLTAETRPLC